MGLSNNIDVAKNSIRRVSTPGAKFVQTMDDTALANPFQISPRLNVPGVPIGVQYAFGPSRPWGIDNWLLKKKNVTNANIVMVLGDIGIGKTSTAKLICLAYAGLSVKGNRYLRIAVDDTRRNDGVPEYGALTNALGEEQIMLADYKINPLDFVLGLAQSEQLAIIRGICEQDSPRIKPMEKFALRTALRVLIAMNPHNASLKTLAGELLKQSMGTSAVGRSGVLANKNVRRQFKMASAEMWIRLDNILEGEYGDVFGDDHNLAEVLSRRVVSLNYTGLPEEALPLIQAIMWRIRTSALKRDDVRFKIDLEVHDENHKMWENLAYANAMYDHIKKIRQTGSVLIMLSHRLNDYYSVGAEGSTQRSKATNMVKDVSAWFIGHQNPDNIPELRERLGANVITTKVADMLTSLGVGEFCVILGQQAPVFVRFHLTEEDKLICESNGANDSQLENYETEEEEEQANVELLEA